MLFLVVENKVKNIEFIIFYIYLVDKIDKVVLKKKFFNNWFCILLLRYIKY